MGVKGGRNPTSSAKSVAVFTSLSPSFLESFTASTTPVTVPFTMLSAPERGRVGIKGGGGGGGRDGIKIYIYIL